MQQADAKRRELRFQIVELLGDGFQSVGIVFDAGENRDLEQGASIWKIENDRIIFHRTYSGINFDRIRPGVTLYKTADPALAGYRRRCGVHATLHDRRPAQRSQPLRRK